MADAGSSRTLRFVVSTSLLAVPTLVGCAKPHGPNPGPVEPPIVNEGPQPPTGEPTSPDAPPTEPAPDPAPGVTPTGDPPATNGGPAPAGPTITGISGTTPKPTPTPKIMVNPGPAPTAKPKI